MKTQPALFEFDFTAVERKVILWEYGCIGCVRVWFLGPHIDSRSFHTQNAHRQAGWGLVSAGAQTQRISTPFEQNDAIIHTWLNTQEKWKCVEGSPFGRPRSSKPALRCFPKIHKFKLAVRMMKPSSGVCSSELTLKWFFNYATEPSELRAIKCIPFRGLRRQAHFPDYDEPHLASCLICRFYLFIQLSVCEAEGGVAGHPAVRQLTNQINSHQYRANPSKSVIDCREVVWSRGSGAIIYAIHPPPPPPPHPSVEIFCVGSTPGCTLLISCRNPRLLPPDAAPLCAHTHTHTHTHICGHPTNWNSFSICQSQKSALDLVEMFFKLAYNIRFSTIRNSIKIKNSVNRGKGSHPCILVESTHLHMC